MCETLNEIRGETARPDRPIRSRRLALAGRAAEWTCELVDASSARSAGVVLSFGQSRASAEPGAGGGNRFVNLRFEAERFTGDEFTLGETLLGYTFHARLAAEGKPGTAQVWARISITGPATLTEHGLTCAVSARVTLYSPPSEGARELHPSGQFVLPGSVAMRVSAS
jgi:hypothetical protein